MEIVFDIKKKHLIFFSIFLVLVGSVFVAATSWEPWDASKPSHDILYTNMIGPKNTEIIPIMDAALKVSGGIIFGTGGEEGNLYKIYATANKLNYGGDGTKNVFRGKICSDNGKCIPVEELIETIKGISDSLNGEGGYWNFYCSGTPTGTCNKWDNFIYKDNCNKVKGCTYNVDIKKCMGKIAPCVNHPTENNICNAIPGCSSE